MTDRYSEDETIAAITLLTRSQLTTFIEAEMVTPLLSDTGPVFRQIDLARLELLCELSEHFDLYEDALGIVISLVDQLYRTRAELRAITETIEAESPEVRVRIGEALRKLSPGT